MKLPKGFSKRQRKGARRLITEEKRKRCISYDIKYKICIAKNGCIGCGFYQTKTNKQKEKQIVKLLKER